jgi:Ca2+-binding EF-hand superfamily protein
MKKLLLSVFLSASVAAALVIRAEEVMAPTKAPVAGSGMSAAAKPANRAEEILKRFDKNGDGRLDDDEKADAHEAMLQEAMAKEAPPESVRSLAHFQPLAVELFDRNYDGRLDEAEQAAATAFLERGEVATTREILLTRFDANRDGKLDDNERREAQAFAIEHRGELLQEVLLRAFDMNGNRQLEPEEKTAVRAALMLAGAPAEEIFEKKAAPPTAAANRPGAPNTPGLNVPPKPGANGANEKTPSRADLPAAK